MRGFDHCTPSSSNAFSPSFLQRLGERDEPDTADARLRSPGSLASLLEAAGAVALERAGAILGSRA